MCQKTCNFSFFLGPAYETEKLNSGWGFEVFNDIFCPLKAKYMLTMLQVSKPGCQNFLFRINTSAEKQVLLRNITESWLTFREKKHASYHKLHYKVLLSVHFILQGVNASRATNG
jgi:hypothetical protein